MTLSSRLTFAVFGRKLKTEKRKMNSTMNTTLDTTINTTSSRARSSISALSDAESARIGCVSNAKILIRYKDFSFNVKFA